MIGAAVTGALVGEGVIGAAVTGALVGDGVTGAAVPLQVEPAWLTQTTASPVVKLMDSTFTVILTLLIVEVQLPPAFNLARRVDSAPPAPSLPAVMIMT